MARTLSTKLGLTMIGLVSLLTLVIGLPTLMVLVISQSYNLNFWVSAISFLISSLIGASVISATIVIGSPTIQHILATFRRLMRFENLSHPLLIRLSVEAPATYHHCLSVATLAHKAAKAIGSDALLARVGAYYHDIGKLVNPENFAENNLRPQKNNLELLPTGLTFQIIKKHVQEGIKLARSYNLPQEVIGIIAQHHGTLVARSFFEKARLDNNKVKLALFRYPGPKPLSKEAAIVMLSDAVESKIRSLKDITGDTIQESVDEIFEERLSQKQFDLSGLNQNQLKIIRKTLIDTLVTMHHVRPAYHQGVILKKQDAA